MLPKEGKWVPHKLIVSEANIDNSLMVCNSLLIKYQRWHI